MIRESRRADRRNVHESIAVLDTMTEQVVGRLGNISESGMLLGANTPLLDDALYQLRFEVPYRCGGALATDPDGSEVCPLGVVRGDHVPGRLVFGDDRCGAGVGSEDRRVGRDRRVGVG